MQTYLLFVIVCFLSLAVILLFLICEILINHEGRKADYKLIRNKSSDGEIYETEDKLGNNISGIAAAANTPGGFVLLPLHRSHQNKDQNKPGAHSSDEVHGKEDPRSPDAWKRQDSGNDTPTFAERKEDPWICKNSSLAVAAPPITNKPLVEEVVQDKSHIIGVDTKQISDTAEIGATGNVISPTTEPVPSITAMPSMAVGNEAITNPTPTSTFSTAGFWEAQEAAKHGGSSGGGAYFGNGYDGGGITSNGWANDSSAGGGSGFGNDGSYAYDLGNDYSTTDKPEWNDSIENC